MVVKILADKKTFVMKSPIMMMVQQTAGEQAQMINKDYDLLVTMLQTIIDSELGTVRGLKQCDLGEVIDRYGPEIVKLLKAVAMSPVSVPGQDEQLKQFRQALIGAEQMTSVVDTVSGDEATITVTMPGSPDETTPMKRIDDRWIPAELADRMPMMMAAAKNAVSGQGMQEMNASLGRSSRCCR